MIKLVAMLEAIRIYGKDCHYTFNGTDWIGKHKYMDDITEPLSDWVDEIKESVVLAKGNLVPRGTELNAMAAEFVPESLPIDDPETLLRNLRAVISMAIDQLNRLSAEATAGESDLYGRIGSHLQKHIGLLNLALKDIK